MLRLNRLWCALAGGRVAHDRTRRAEPRKKKKKNDVSDEGARPPPSQLATHRLLTKRVDIHDFYVAGTLGGRPTGVDLVSADAPAYPVTLTKGTTSAAQVPGTSPHRLANLCRQHAALTTAQILCLSGAGHLMLGDLCQLEWVGGFQYGSVGWQLPESTGRGWRALDGESGKVLVNSAFYVPGLEMSECRGSCHRR